MTTRAPAVLKNMTHMINRIFNKNILPPSLTRPFLKFLPYLSWKGVDPSCEYFEQLSRVGTWDELDERCGQEAIKVLAGACQWIS